MNNYSNIIFRFGLLKKPLQRMTVGGILTAASFFISGFLELELQKTYANVSFPTKVKRLLQYTPFWSKLVHFLKPRFYYFTVFLVERILLANHLAVFLNSNFVDWGDCSFSQLQVLLN